MDLDSEVKFQDLALGILAAQSFDDQASAHSAGRSADPQTVVTGSQMSLFDLPVYRKGRVRRQARLAVRHRHRQRARFGPLQSLLAPAPRSLARARLARASIRAI